MIDFEGCYLVAAEQIESVSVRNGGGPTDSPYGLFVRMTSGRELGVWYRTEAARKAGLVKLARQIENERRGSENTVLGRLYQIEAAINRVDKRTLRIWRQLKGLLHLESEDTE